MIAPDTPDDVDVRAQSADPYPEATCGVPVHSHFSSRTPKHRFFVIGDSLSQGFKSGAGFDTHLSWPALVATQLGLDPSLFHTRLDALGGLPFNLERAVRAMDRRFGDTIGPHERALVPAMLYRMLDQIEDHWERGPGTLAPFHRAQPTFNLSVFGFDLRDTISYTAEHARTLLRARPRDNVRRQIVENAQAIVARQLLEGAANATGARTSPIALARAVSAGSNTPGDNRNQTDEGIETLVIMIGANNALASIAQLHVRWSGDDFADLTRKHRYTVWRPTHFERELRQLEHELESVHARHVIIANIPHVTIAPLAHGVGRDKYEPGSRYFAYYTRPWIGTGQFDARRSAHLTSGQARAIDSAIDQYNRAIYELVRRARLRGRDYLLLDICSVLDRLAQRRYIDDPQARPHWWSPYLLPHELAELSPPPDSRFFGANRFGRTAGGLFSLDGTHPTTIGYGILANEVMRVMVSCGVQFAQEPQVDFRNLILQDSLISSPPRSVQALTELLSWWQRAVTGLGKLAGKRQK
jgi:hypothetical protein